MKLAPQPWKPILTLLLATPVLTELLSNNLAPSTFFKPQAFIFLATIAYGFPILLLREFAVRRRLGLPALMCLGLAYGIFNEGLLAKTFYLAQNVPVNAFDGYAFRCGIAFPWALMISIWHSLHAVLYPLLIPFWWFPKQREQPWLGRTAILCVALPVILLGTLIFFTRSLDREPGCRGHFLFMLVSMAALCWIAASLPPGARLVAGGAFGWFPIFCGGLAFLSLVFVPVLLAKTKVTPWAFFGYFAVAGGLILRWLFKQSTVPLTGLLLFAIGDEIVLVLFALLGAIGQGSMEKAIVDLLFLTAFALFIVRLKRGVFNNSIAPEANNTLV